MQKSITQISILGLALLVAGCATTSTQTQAQTEAQTQRAPGFLPDYSLLKPMPSPEEGTQIYAYKASNVKRSDYNAAIVEPVLLYQAAAKGGVTNAQIEDARANINAGIKQIVGRKLKLTNMPGSGVLRLQVAITGASLEAEGLKPRNILPISAAIKLASIATGMDSKKPALMVELKLVDSQSGRLLKEIVTIISGDSFRNQADTSDAFAKLAQTWVQQSLQYSS